MSLQHQLLDGMTLFVEVVRSGSFTKTANKLGHSTSYISKEISKLEDRLGTRLLHRTTRRLSLTTEGESFFARCENIIEEAEAAVNQLQGGHQEPHGTLRVTCSIGFGLSRLRPVIAEFTEQFPEIKLELELSDGKTDLVAEGFDIAIRASAELEDSSLICRRFIRSGGLILASPDYLACHGKPSTPQELANHQTISYSLLKTPNHWPYIDRLGVEQHVEVNSRIVTNSPDMELSLCLAGQGITRLPAFNLNGELESGALVQLFPELALPPINVYMVYPSRKHLSAKVQHFIAFVIDALGDTSN